MMKVTWKQKSHKKKKKRPSCRESPASSEADLISALFFGIPCKVVPADNTNDKESDEEEDSRPCAKKAKTRAWVKGQDISVLPPYEHPKPAMILAPLQYFNLCKTLMRARRYYMSLFGYVMDITMCNAWLL
ncbi:hypothetical protein E2C01_096889 [Portunus trituberculatus]|uniref:PiggyBac transposable element-derived protein domain-containing protein n=1 Tax=Portunus trituberculatus TaxID=210409 RepID=A0A5B7K379_PORTR|nr:hypothetical protein [Portunus trituberculatus]